MPTRQSSPTRNRGARQLRPDLLTPPRRTALRMRLSFSGSWRSVQARCGPRRRLIRPYPKHALRRLDFVTGTPPRNEGACECSVEEIDRHRIVEHPAHPGRCHCPAIGAAILAEPRGHFGMTLAEPPGGTPILMRTGKRRSAKTITSRALPGIPCSSFVLTYMARSPLAVQMNKPKPLRFLSLKHGRLGRRHDRVPRIGRYRSVQPLMPYHV
jgi:hypothetical protein